VGGRLHEQLESEVKQLHGLKKLQALNQLTEYFIEDNLRKALRYGKQAVSQGENIFVASNTLVKTEDQVQLIYFQLGKCISSARAFLNHKAARDLANEMGERRYQQEGENYLARIQAKIDAGEIKKNLLSQTIGKLDVGDPLTDAARDLGIKAEIQKGRAKEKKGDFEGAIENYEKAVQLMKDKGDAEGIWELQLNIAVLLDSLEQHEQALSFLEEAILEAEPIRDTSLAQLPADTIRSLPEILPKPERKALESMRSRQESLKELSESYAKEKDYEKSLEYYKLYQELNRKRETDSLSFLVESRLKGDEILLLKQQKRIAEMNVAAAEQEKERQTRLRKTLFLVAAVILISALVIFYFYITKRREHQKLAIAYRDLDKIKNKLESAEQQIRKLLDQQVSGAVARELLANNTNKPGERRYVCIMFLDVRDFTPMAEKMSPEELITFQNNAFGFMIDIIQKYHGHMNQLLGDGFMATFGAPVSEGNDCQNAYNAAREIIREVNERSKAGVIPKTRIGIGLHAGFVVTGNVGTEARKQYSITGNSVIIASRVEQLNKTFKSQLIITSEVYEKLDDPGKIIANFKDVEVKGRSHPVKVMKIA
jgi:adenylate cyclase